MKNTGAPQAPRDPGSGPLAPGTLLPPEPAELPELVAEINITPLTDVFLVLLIIFMVSSSAMVEAAHKAELDVSLPAAGASVQGSRAGSSLVVGVLADGRIFVDGHSLSLAELEPLLKQTYKNNAATVVIVDADGAVAHRHVVAVIDQVRATGFVSVAIGAQNNDPS